MRCGLRFNAAVLNQNPVIKAWVVGQPPALGFGFGVVDDVEPIVSRFGNNGVPVEVGADAKVFGGLRWVAAESEHLAVWPVEPLDSDRAKARLTDGGIDRSVMSEQLLPDRSESLECVDWMIVGW